GSSGTKDIKVPQDLREMKVGAIKGSAASNYLDSERISYRSFSDPSEALNAVSQKDIDAVLHTVPALRYHINNDPDLSLKVKPLKPDPHYYAFAVAPNTHLREEINLGLLRILNTGLWQQERDRFIPEKGK
ncbi:MAG: transporter substrate-binding domain-containing protein, partial [Christiangramia sp.]|nr:transporter substrate-binding domain-containing protein [Christiangramia sp.]